MESVAPKQQANLLVDAHGQVKGIPTSGRRWKLEKQRFSGLQKDKPLKSTWDRKMAEKRAKKNIKEFQTRLNETRRQEKLAYNKRVEDHRKHKEENQRKSEIVQVIKNSAKLKRMKKKQLRQIEKRDTSKVKTQKILHDVKTKKVLNDVPNPTAMETSDK